MAIIANRIRDGIGFAFIGVVIGYLISCFLPPYGWAFLAPMITVLMGARFDIALILLAAIVGSAFATAGLARLCPFRVKPWIIICVGALLTAASVSTYLGWLYAQVPEGYSGPLFG
jgi:hypothetical protein